MCGGAGGVGADRGVEAPSFQAIPIDTQGAVTIPSTLGGRLVTSIGSKAFEDCSGLTSVTIPSSVTSIGDSAFSRCRGLKSVTIPSGVTSIGQAMFSDCSGLTSVTIPEGVTSIGDSAFSRCRGLKSVTIPSSVTSIGYGAFEDCKGLTSVTIPAGVTNIGWRAFAGCSGLKSVTFEGKPPEGMREAGIDGAALIRYPARYESEWPPVLEKKWWQVLKDGISYKHEAVK